MIDARCTCDEPTRHRPLISSSQAKVGCAAGAMTSDPQRNGSGSCLRALNLAIEHLWREIRAVRPHDSACLGVDPNTNEHIPIANRSEHRPPQPRLEVNDAIGSVIEQKAQSIVAYGFNAGNARSCHLSTL